MLLTGARLWLPPDANLLASSDSRGERWVLALHVVGGAVLLALVVLLRTARLAAAAVLVALASGYAIPDPTSGWFAYAPNSGDVYAPGYDPEWHAVHVVVLAPVAASAVAYALGRRRGQAVEEPAGPDDVGAG